MTRDRNQTIKLFDGETLRPTSKQAACKRMTF